MLTFPQEVPSWDLIDEWSSIGKCLLSSSDIVQNSPTCIDSDKNQSDQITKNQTKKFSISKKGCRGVYFDTVRHLWRANWPEETVVIDRRTKKPISIKRCTRTKGFSAKKFGFDESRRLAIQHRKEMINSGIIKHYVYIDDYNFKFDNIKKKNVINIDKQTNNVKEPMNQVSDYSLDDKKSDSFNKSYEYGVFIANTDYNSNNNLFNLSAEGEIPYCDTDFSNLSEQEPFYNVNSPFLYDESVSVPPMHDFMFL